jgi:3-methyladenine DNA glycosylase/8-oxoguanine DNA glycosylase
VAVVERRIEVRPRWAFRLPQGGGMDGVLRRRDGVLQRLVHVGGEAVVVRAAQPATHRVVLGAQGTGAEACDEALRRMRFALGLDDDLSAFHARFRDDPVIGPVVRAAPWLRAARRPDPFEALAWAVCEQLIEYGRAAAIQRRIVFRLGRRCERTGLRDLPAAATLAAQAPALLQSFDLAAGRAVALIRCAREVASGRVDLFAPDHERGWRRLRTIPGIGSWTIQCLALHGQGRHDAVLAGDLHLRKLVGRLTTGDPQARVGEEEVAAYFAPYEEWAGLAATYALRAPAVTPPPPTGRPAPRRGGTRSSGPARGPRPRAAPGR